MGDLWALKGLIEEGMYRYFLLYLYVYQVRCRLFTIQLQFVIVTSMSSMVCWLLNLLMKVVEFIQI